MTSDTAVLVIDMEQGMVRDGPIHEKWGWPLVVDLEETIEQTRLMLEEARAQGMPVIYSIGKKGIGPRRDRMLRDERLRAKLTDEDREILARRPTGIFDELAPVEGDIVLEKTRWDFFLYTELDAVLKNLGVTRLIVSGINTNCCVETTARTGMQLNYEVAVPSDACSSDKRELHDNALKSMKVLYIEVAPWRDLLDPAQPWIRNTVIGYGHDELY